MSQRCDWLQSRFDIVRVDALTAEPGNVTHQCLRPEGHAGPHLIKHLDQVGGGYVVWEEDCCPWGECPDCDSEDPLDNCLAYRVVSEVDAKRLIEDGEYEL